MHWKKLIWYIIDDVENSSDDSNEKQMKAKNQDVFWGSEFEAVNLLQNVDLNKKVESIYKNG